MSSLSNNKTKKRFSRINLENQYVELFDKLLKYIDILGYKCVFNVKLKHPWVSNHVANKLYRAYYVVHYQCVRKDVDDVKALMSHTDMYVPDCVRLNKFLYKNRAFMQKGKDIHDSLFYENYVNVSLSEMFIMFRTPKKLFCSLFIPDILNCGIAIRDIFTYDIKYSIIKPESSIEESLMNLDLLTA